MGLASEMFIMYSKASNHSVEVLCGCGKPLQRKKDEKEKHKNLRET